MGTEIQVGPTNAVMLPMPVIPSRVVANSGT
jgi:hypothetical protein